jgi:hypothetical protein
MLCARYMYLFGTSTGPEDNCTQYIFKKNTHKKKNLTEHSTLHCMLLPWIGIEEIELGTNQICITLNM